MPATLAMLRLAFAVLVLLPAIAQAQGLGPIKVHSALGEPLRAEVSIIASQPGKLGGLVARVAAPDRYKAMGIEFDPVLFSIKVSVESRDGKPVLLLSSARPIKEPYLDLLLELDTGSGRLTRDYTILLDSR